MSFSLTLLPTTILLNINPYFLYIMFLDDSTISVKRVRLLDFANFSLCLSHPFQDIFRLTAANTDFARSARIIRSFPSFSITSDFALYLYNVCIQPYFRTHLRFLPKFQVDLFFWNLFGDYDIFDHIGSQFKLATDYSITSLRFYELRYLCFYSAIFW